MVKKLTEYEYIIAKNFFIEAKVEAGLTYFKQEESNFLNMLYLISGISVGWNGF